MRARGRGRGARRTVAAPFAAAAPHVPATPAHEYENAPLPGGVETAPRTPSWDYGTQHHHWLVSDKAPMAPALVTFSDQLFARRLRATMSVDDILAAVFALLEARGALEDTYVVYTSDHGYDLGQFRLPSGKRGARTCALTQSLTPEPPPGPRQVQRV